MSSLLTKIQSEEEIKILEEIDLGNRQMDRVLSDLEENLCNGLKLGCEQITNLQRELHHLENRTSFWRTRLADYS